MRSWLWSGGLVACFGLGVGCGDDGVQSKPDGSAGEAGSAGGSDAAAAGSPTGSDSAGEGGGTGVGGDAGSAEQFLPLYESGTRLRAVSLGEPGSSQRKLLAWYDSELDAQCRFKLAEDGELRCLPVVENGLSAGFADAACQQPVLYDSLVTPCLERPLFQVKGLDEGVCATHQVWQLTALELSLVYNEACGAVPQQLEPTARVYTSEAMAPALFVRGQRAERLGSAGFGVTEITAEDGAREVTGVVLAEFGDCQPRDVKDRGLRCVPHRAYLDGPWFFADDACDAEPLAYAIATEDCAMDTEPVMALVFDPDARLDPPALISIGPALEGNVYEQSGALCTEQDAADVQWNLHRPLDPFDVEQLLGLSVEPSGAGRIRLPHYASDGTLLTLEYRGDHQGQAIFHDTTLGAPCFALPLEDGSYRCLPDGARGRGESLYFADDACSEPVLLAPTPEAGYFAPYRDDYCSQELSNALGLGPVYELGETGTGDVYQATAAEDCELFATDQAFTRLSPNDELAILDVETE